MTEADLESLLEHGARRLKAQQAVRAGLAALGIGLVLAAMAIFVARWFAPSGSIAEALVLPAALAATAWIVTYIRHRPTTESVALLIDARAGNAEHLVTWHFLKHNPGAQSALREAFRSAQLASTLRCAAELNPRRLIPIRLPAWSRALWLAMLLLCCALLMPPRASASRGGPNLSAGQQAKLGIRRGAVGLGEGGAPITAQPRVQVLKPTDLLMFQLKASDPDLPAAARSEALKELLSKIGNVPESELAPEVRDLLNSLRENGAAKPGSENGKLDTKDGSRQITVKNGAHDAGGPAAIPAAAQVPDFHEKAMTTARQHFPDVKEQLERYYQESGK